MLPSMWVMTITVRLHGALNNPPSPWHTSDPLWDGVQCGGDEGPCCNHTGLPWFNKNTPTPTTATINVRICLDEDTSNENLGVEHLELFVKITNNADRFCRCV